MHTLAGHFRTTALLKSGRGVDTFLGVDVEHGDRVIIKKARSSAVSPAAQLRLEHEADVLKELSRPSLGVASPIDVGREDGEFYLVAPYVPGTTLAERLTRGPLTVREALAVGRGLMRALSEAHEHGIIHRDIKPANLVLGEATEPRVTLIDFGFARTPRVESWLRDEPVGTIAYVSPEQAGLINVDVGERSDLYSAGVVLFECLAGRPPFTGATVAEVLRQHATVPAPPLRSLGLNVPHALDAVIQRLLRKDPRDRYQSASAAFDDFDAIARALDAGQTDPAIVVGARDRRQWLTEPAFVGRKRELRALDAELDRARAGDARLVFVEAESGAGKTRLLEEMAVHGAQLGAWVLRGQATSRGVQRPLEILQGVAREVVARAHEDPSLAIILAERLGEHVPALCAALPVLAEVLAPDRPTVIGTEAHGEARSIPAITALLDALGTPERMAVLVLDDGQCADEMSLKVLAAWQKAHTATSRVNVLIAVAYRSDEVELDHPLRRIVSSLRLELAPLAHDDIERLTESMAGKLPGSATELVARLSQGSPFFAVAALEGLVDGGALIATGHGWEIEPRAMASAQSSNRGASFLATRVERLPTSVRNLLSACAILGKTFELPLAAELSGCSVAEAMNDIVEARRRHLVWADVHGEKYSFAHDRVRDRLLERLSLGERRRLHRLAAQRLEARRGDAELQGRLSHADLVFDLAYHFDEAGDPRSALPYALEAAVRARSQYAFEIAERQYRIAERGVDERERDGRREISEALGDVLMLRGKYDEAAIEFGQARALAASPIAEARIDGKLGELSFKRGCVEEAGAAIERALATLGRKQPTTTLALVFAALGQALLQALHTIFPRMSLGRRGEQDREADLLAVHLYSRLAYAYWFYRGQVATFWAHLSELNIAERHPPSRELAQAYSEHALGMTGLPRRMFRRGRRYAERAIVMRRALGDLPGEAQAMSFCGMLLHAEGRYPEALEKFRESSRVLRRVGDLWEANVAEFQIASCLYRMGSLRDAVEQCRSVVQRGAEIGDVHATAFVLEIWAKATGGAVPVELIETALTRSHGDPQTQEAVLQAQGLRLIREGEPRRAVEAFAEAERVVKEAKLESEYVSYLSLWRGHALRIAAERANGTIVAARPRVLPAAERAVRRGVRRARRYRGNLPMALREKALLLVRRGAFMRAQRAIDHSLVEAEALGMRFEYAQSLLVRGELGRLRGRPGAADECEQARTLLHELNGGFVLGAPDKEGQRPAITLSLADRFASVVDAGRKIAAALTPDDIYRAVCAAASSVLRGQTASVLITEGNDFCVASCAGRGHQSSFSRTLANRAMTQAHPVTWTDALPDGVLESVTLGGVRSALCAPILAGGRAVAALYVTHDLVGSLFGDDERRLAEYIAALAGASLERADAFAELHALSLSLEHRVRDRTAELRAANEELDRNLHRLRETQEQLLQTGKMAAMGTLIAGLSHEINNPIAVILAQTQSLLRKADEQHPFRPPLEAIGRQAKRCADLVRTMLDFTRKSSGTPSATPVAQLLGDVAELARTRARNVDVKLEIADVPPDVSTVSVARTEIESALLNLMNNAIDASARSATVKVGARRCERERRPGVEIYVEDRGQGIPADVLPRIFDPFFTTKPVGLGTGLGLSLALRIVEAHGGKLQAESRVGDGTTMRVWLPAGGAK